MLSALICPQEVLLCQSGEYIYKLSIADVLNTARTAPLLTSLSKAEMLTSCGVASLILMRFLFFSKQSPLHPIPASPTSPQSGLDGSNSTLSGSASSGVSSLSESNFGHSSEPPPRTDTMDSVPSQAWNTDEDLETPYLPVRYSLSEPDVLESLKSQPCRSHSAPSGVIPQDTLDPPALPPKPYHSRLPNIENEEGMIIEDDDKHRQLHRKVSQPVSGGKEEQARVAWEHGISEQ